MRYKSKIEIRSDNLIVEIYELPCSEIPIQYCLQNPCEECRKLFELLK